MKLSIVAGGGTLLGLIFGFIGSFAFRTHFTDHYRLIEPLLMFSICYLRSVRKSSELENCASSEQLHFHALTNQGATNWRIYKISKVFLSKSSYLTAEMMDLSAILSIIFCSFVMMHRCSKILSVESHLGEFYFVLTSLDMRWTNVHYIFKMTLKNDFTSIPSD